MRFEKHMMTMLISGVEGGFYYSSKNALKRFLFSSKRAFIKAENIFS
jgi:hypothetical protein